MAPLPAPWPRPPATLVLQTHALVISITQLASPAPVIARVVATDPRRHMMQVDFEDFLALTLTTLVRGVRTARTRRGRNAVALSGLKDCCPCP